jgi:hypothetical protein
LTHVMGDRTSHPVPICGIMEPMIGYKTAPLCTLDADEVRALAKFVSGHNCPRDLSIEYSTATGIGRNLVVRCLCGKADADITNYSAW